MLCVYIYIYHVCNHMIICTLYVYMYEITYIHTYIYIYISNGSSPAFHFPFPLENHEQQTSSRNGHVSHPTPKVWVQVWHLQIGIEESPPKASIEHPQLHAMDPELLSTGCW